MFSIEKIARVTCMLDNNLLINMVLYIMWHFLTQTINTASFCEYLHIV